MQRDNGGGETGVADLGAGGYWERWGDNGLLGQGAEEGVHEALYESRTQMKLGFPREA